MRLMADGNGKQVEGLFAEPDAIQHMRLQKPLRLYLP
jgi:hypothetical protein